MESNSRALHLSTENLCPSRSWNISARIVCRYQRVPTICMCYQGLCKLKTVCATNGTAMPSPHASLSSVVPSPLGFSCYTPYKAHRCPQLYPIFYHFLYPLQYPLIFLAVSLSVLLLHSLLYVSLYTSLNPFLYRLVSLLESFTNSYIVSTFPCCISMYAFYIPRRFPY